MHGCQGGLSLIACEVLRMELELLTRRLQSPPELIFLRQGLHDTPDELRRQVQQTVDDLEAQGARTILLGYGLCGRGLSGVRARQATLVLPRVHDCIPLLLGVEQPEAERLSLGGSTFWTSPGWLACSQVNFIRNRPQRLADYSARFGEESAVWLMEQEAEWLKNYRRVCHISWPEFEGTEEVELDMARLVAQDAKLPFAEQPGTDDFLSALLHGGHDRRFLRLAPGETVDLDEDGKLIAIR